MTTNTQARNTLIQKLVDRKLASADKNKVGCVPCFGRALCFAINRDSVTKK